MNPLISLVSNHAAMMEAMMVTVLEFDGGNLRKQGGER